MDKRSILIISGFIFVVCCTAAHPAAGAGSEQAAATDKADKPAESDTDTQAKPDTASGGDKHAEEDSQAWNWESESNVTGKLLVSILIITVLGAAAFILSRKLLPKIANAQGRQIQLIETLHLAPGKAVHLLTIGRRKILVASSKDGVRYLTDLSEFSESAFKELEQCEG